jgi:hypothetical protein
MAKKAKLSNETYVKAEEIIAYYGYSSLDELIENLVNNEYQKIKSEDGKDEQAEKLSGLGYIS